jgi:HTH-type transcriptional regulator/antitoxin HigA
MNMVSCMTDVPHPGDFIRDELDARGWSQRDLAYILGSTEQAVNLIVSGKRGISPEVAKALGDAFDVSAEYFANLQKMYEMAHARAPDPGISRRASLQTVFPIRDMIKRGWLEDTEISLLELQVMRFFSKNNLADVPYLAHAARKCDYSETNPTQLAWLFRCKQMASEMTVAPFSEKRLREFISEMPRLMVDPEEIRHVPRMLREAGIRYVVVETLPKTNIDGVCFWIGDVSPVIGMTTRHDRIDNFWFVLRHEIEHVLNKDGRGELLPRYVDIDIENSDDELPLCEVKANSAASECCVPQEQLENFYLRKFPYISERDVLAFARRIQRHPGIVVGQLQRKMQRFDWLTRYKVKVRQALIGVANMDGWGAAAPITL